MFQPGGWNKVNNVLVSDKKVVFFLFVLDIYFIVEVGSHWLRMEKLQKKFDDLTFSTSAWFYCLLKKPESERSYIINFNVMKIKFRSFFCFVLQAYASGCDVVILLSGFTRVQIISGSLYGYKEVSCIDCCDSDGKVQQWNFLFLYWGFMWCLIYNNNLWESSIMVHLRTVTILLVEVWHCIACSGFWALLLCCFVSYLTSFQNLLCRSPKLPDKRDFSPLLDWLLRFIQFRNVCISISGWCASSVQILE